MINLGMFLVWARLFLFDSQFNFLFLAQVLGMKIFAMVPVSMTDEQMMSMITWLNSAWQNRQDLKTLQDHIKIRQWHHAGPGAKVSNILLIVTALPTKATIIEQKYQAQAIVEVVGSWVDIRKMSKLSSCWQVPAFHWPCCPKTSFGVHKEHYGSGCRNWRWEQLVGWVAPAWSCRCWCGASQIYMVNSIQFQIPGTLLWEPVPIHHLAGNCKIWCLCLFMFTYRHF